MICHHGSVSGGHYTCYAQNWSNCRWYEFDDQCVTEVSQDTVANCEAYVLFYKKSSMEMISRRQRTIELMQVSIMKIYHLTALIICSYIPNIIFRFSYIFLHLFLILLLDTRWIIF